ncbi:MAG TPA: hypothetical protein VM536_10945 [Chloroflexia bacterium]|nr:hypothetical protein [Chloroflexia bacterium]
MYRRTMTFLLALGLLAGCGPFGPAEPTATPPATVAPTSGPTSAPAPSATLEVAATATEPVASATKTAPVAADATGTAPTAGSGTASPGAAVPEGTVLPATQKQLATIESQTTSLRGLRPKTDVPEHFVSSDQIEANLADEIADEYSHEEARQDALDLWLLRLIDDRTVDLYQLQIDLLGEQVLGYYDPKKDELFVRNDQQPMGLEAQETLAHEFVHSLQDEYYDLEKLRPEDAHNSDRDTALTSLIEGDATLAGILWAQKYMSAKDFQTLVSQSSNADTTVLDKAPAYIRESLIFPYDQGGNFVVELYKRGGFSAIDKAFAAPPQSSEQILHPEKYLATPQDPPVDVSLPPLTSTLGTGWKQSSSDTVGEFDLGVLLRTNGVDDPAAAAGWGGARYAAYEGNGAAVLILGTRWDTPQDAVEFESAMTKTFAQAEESDGVWSIGGRFFAMQRAGDAVTVVSGTDRDAVTRALGAVK